MKAKFFLLFLFFSFCSLHLFAQNWVWAKGATSTNNSASGEAYGVATDAAGNSYVTGGFEPSSITFGAYTLNQLPGSIGYDFFLAKYDASGAVQWLRGAPGKGDENSNSGDVATDPAGNVYVTGSFDSSPIAFGTYTLTPAALGNTSVFLVKYDAAGNVLWAKNSLGAGGYIEQGYAVTSDPFGNAYITGYFRSPTVNFGGITLIKSAGFENAYLVKYDPNGNVLWATSAGGNSLDNGYGVAADAAGNVYWAGKFQSANITFGATTLTNTGSVDIFLAKYDPSGTPLWAKNIGGTGADGGAFRGVGVTTDPFNNVILASEFASTSITLGATTLNNTSTTAGYQDVFIAKYDPAGALLWTKSATGAGNDVGFTVDADPSGNIYMSGGFSCPGAASITFGAITVPYPAGSNDPAFIVMYDPFGNELCASGLASGGDDRNALSTDASGNAYLTGDFRVTPFTVGATTLNLSSGTTSGGEEDAFLAKYTCNVFSVNTTHTDPPCNAQCAGTATVNVTNGCSPYTYSWSNNNETTQTVTGLCAGSYTVIVTDNVGSSSTQTLTISEPAVLSASVTPTNITCNAQCNGAAMAAASGGSPGYTYLWDNTQTTVNATGLCKGDYTCTVTDVNGCTATQTIAITEPAPLSNSVTITDATCNLCNGSAQVIASGGNPGYTYLWDNLQTTGNATGLCSGNYTCTVTDVNGCSGIATASVSVGNAPVPNIILPTSILCNGGNTSANVTTAGGTSPYTFNWSNGQTTQSVTGLTAGDYTVAVTDGSGCTGTKTVTIAEPTAVTATVSSTSSGCIPNGTMAADASGGTPAYTFMWDNGQTTSTATGLSGGNYSVTISDGNGCSIVKTVSVTTVGGIAANISVNSQVLCNGGADGSASVIVNAGTPSYTYSWFPSGGTDATATGLIAGNYSATITDANGCVSVQNINITEPAALSSSVTAVSASCNTDDGAASVTVSGGTSSYTYLWNNSETTTAITGLSSGNYSVSVIDAHGCTVTATVAVSGSPAVTANAGTDITINQGEETTLTGSGGANYLWDNGSTDSVISVSPAFTTTYCITVSNGKNCTDMDCVTITVIPEPVDCADAGELYLPNAFSPNNDGENDALEVYYGNLDCIKTFELHIYNRWGQKVFETKDPSAKWDGTFHGKPEGTAVFAYYMKAAFVTGKETIKEGNISLIR